MLRVPASFISLPSLRAERSNFPEGLPSKSAFPCSAVNFILLYATFEGAISTFPTSASSGPLRSASIAVMLPFSIAAFPAISWAILSVQSAKRRFRASAFSSRYFPGALVSSFIDPRSDESKTLLSSSEISRTPSSYLHLAATSSSGTFPTTAFLRTPSPEVKMSLPSPLISIFTVNVPVTPYFEKFGNIEAIVRRSASFISALKSGTGYTAPEALAEPSSSLAEKPSSSQFSSSFLTTPNTENGISRNLPLSTGANHSSPRSSSELSSSSRSPHWEDTLTSFSIILSIGISFVPALPFFSGTILSSES